MLRQGERCLATAALVPLLYFHFSTLCLESVWRSFCSAHLIRDILVAASVSTVIHLGKFIVPQKSYYERSNQGNSWNLKKQGISNSMWRYIKLKGSSNAVKPQPKFDVVEFKTFQKLFLSSTKAFISPSGSKAQGFRTFKLLCKHRTDLITASSQKKFCGSMFQTEAS